MIRLEKTVLVSEELRVLANQDGPGWLRCFKGTNLVQKPPCLFKFYSIFLTLLLETDDNCMPASGRTTADWVCFRSRYGLLLIKDDTFLCSLLVFAGYVTYFLDLIGVADYFTVSVILYVIMLLSNVCAFFFVEYAGRRALIVPGTMTLTAILLLMGICGAVNTPGAVWVVVVCIFAWYVYQSPSDLTAFSKTKFFP